MGMDARSSWIAHQIVLIAVAIQGLTPDFRNLSSPWLFRIVTWELVDLAGGHGSESPPGEDHDEGPDDVCAANGLDAILRLRFDAGSQYTAELTPVRPSERLIRSTTLSSLPHIISSRGGDDLIRSLCRFLC
jgi:hypothetical protein